MGREISYKHYRIELMRKNLYSLSSLEAVMEPWLLKQNIANQLEKQEG